MKKPNISLFIASMAFLLALFAYFHSHSVIKEGHGFWVGPLAAHKHAPPEIPGVMPGAVYGSPMMLGSWKITSGKDLIFEKGPAKFTMGSDGILKCRGAKLKGPLESWTAKIGKPGPLQWHIRKDKIGIPGRADISMDKDKWVRLLDFSTKKWAGKPGKGGWAGFNLWAHVKDKGQCYCPMGLKEVTQERGGGKAVTIFGTAKNNPKTGGAAWPAATSAPSL